MRPQEAPKRPPRGPKEASNLPPRGFRDASQETYMGESHCSPLFDRCPQRWPHKAPQGAQTNHSPCNSAPARASNSQGAAGDAPPAFSIISLLYTYMYVHAQPHDSITTLLIKFSVVCHQKWAEASRRALQWVLHLLLRMIGIHRDTSDGGNLCCRKAVISCLRLPPLVRSASHDHFRALRWLSAPYASGILEHGFQAFDSCPTVCLLLQDH